MQRIRKQHTSTPLSKLALQDRPASSKKPAHNTPSANDRARTEVVRKDPEVLRAIERYTQQLNQRQVTAIQPETLEPAAAVTQQIEPQPSVQLDSAARALADEITRFTKLNSKFDLHTSAQSEEPYLHQALRDGHTHLVQAMIQQGYNVNAPSRNDYTPLHAAAHYAPLETVKILVQHGAKYIHTWKGTPLDIARKLGRTEIAEYLETLTPTTINQRPIPCTPNA